MEIQDIKAKYANTEFLSDNYKKRFASVKSAVDAIGFLADLSILTKHKQFEDNFADWADFVNILSDELYSVFNK